jgi:hypothetical protein
MSTAASIARALKGRKSGAGYVARCPAHDDRTPSLSLRDGPNGLLVHCFAGCEPRDVFEALRAMELLSVTIHGNTRNKHGADQGVINTLNHRDDAVARTAKALALWNEAETINNTRAATYIAHRGITEMPPDVHESLRFHPKVIFGKDDADQWRIVPCLLCLVRNVVTDQPQAVQRVDLTSNWDHSDRMALGPIANGAVKLFDDSEVTTGLVIAEGVETALAASVIEHQGTLLRPIWATLNAGNMQEFPVLPGIQALTIVVDADASGRGQQAAAECAERWQAAEREVTRLTPKQVQR